MAKFALDRVNVCMAFAFAKTITSEKIVSTTHRSGFSTRGVAMVGICRIDITLLSIRYRFYGRI